MSLFFIKHPAGIHEITDLRLRQNTIELLTATGTKLHLVVVTDDSYTVYDDRFAGASKRLNSIEVFDINGSFKNVDFDPMRVKFEKAFQDLLEELSKYVGKNEVVDLVKLNDEISEHFKGLNFAITLDSNILTY